MFEKEYEASASGAAAKVRFLKENPLGYVMVSLLGGAYLGFGILLTYTIKSYLGTQPSAHIIMGLSFGVALSLVIMAGAEMFTGDAFILYNGLRRKTVTAWDVVKLLVICYIGNWLGALILSSIFYGTGLDTGAMAQSLTEAAALRMNLPPLEIFCRGILCNVLVCLAVWCSFRCKSDSAKLIMIFWCLYVFYTIGFGHCIANMTLMDLALLAPHPDTVNLTNYVYNLCLVTAGNIAGAIFFVSIPMASHHGAGSEKGLSHEDSPF
ncbi:MAG: formate/nitrite transporter family protein [Megasphaera sp.]|uniref:formate/nitrite transporter family protein n=1 Tax=Megasphaera sp. TaxID=2023260 RepID=UPI0025C74120|nr:formate/nitrite transporter family protein [Megasphaera sp.]MCI7601351.1 formate/nitrite transporter family protein [Megasphaera sp.]